ncbi:unnamed protein product, partial [Polarella glacialis]
SHIAYSTPNAELARAAETVRAKGNLGFTGKWDQPPNQSMYRHEYCMNRNASAPSCSIADLEVERSPDLLPGDHPGFSVRRACFLSPGQ